MLPVVLALLWWWCDRQWRWTNVFRLAPFLAVSAAASLWTIWEQQFHSGARGQTWTQSGAERLAVAGKVVWFYLGKLLWPRPLIFIYPRWNIDPSAIASYLPALAVAVVLGFLWWKRAAAPWRPIFFCFAYFVVSLFPVMDFFKVYFFRYSFVSDHFQYLASLGPLALAGAGIAAALGRVRHTLLNQVLCGALLLTLAVLTWAQCWSFVSMEALWRSTLAQNPHCAMARDNLARELARRGQLDEAVFQLKKGLESEPNDADAHYDLGSVLYEQGRMEDAAAEFQKALAINPNFAYARIGLEKAQGKQQP